jgi:hypothetical protein
VSRQRPKFDLRSVQTNREFCVISGGLKIRKMGTFFGHLEYFTDIWDSLRLEKMGTFFGHLEYFADIWDVL